MSDETAKPESDKESAQTAPTIPWIAPDEGICEVYSNLHHLNWTLYDVRIRFAQIVPSPYQPPESAGWAISEQAAVTMPWGQAKLLRDMLSEAIQRYETLNGEIKQPKLPT